MSIVIAPPVISLSQTNNLTTFTGHSVYIACSAVGKPSPLVNWFKMIDGERNKVIDNTEDGILYLNKLVKKDEGIYICVASNEAGKSQKDVQVFVNGKFIFYT